NLMVSIAMIALQAILTVAAMLAIDGYGLPELWRAAGAAAALMVALGVSSLVKATMLSRLLGETVNNWRWALIVAAAAGVVVGQVAIRLPEWAELVFGIPAILGAYGCVIWRRGFGPEDRVLFSRNKAKTPSETRPSTPPTKSG